MRTFLKNGAGMVPCNKWEPNCWVNVVKPTTQDKAYLINTLDVPLAFYEDIEDVDERPRVEVEDGWCLIGLMTGSYNTQSKPSDDIVELGGFPTDVDIELPFVADNINSIQTYGVDMLQATIKDAVLTVKNIPWGWGGYPKDNFLYAACVRNKE